MSAPTNNEREYYAKIVGRRITGFQWDDIDGRPLPILILSGAGKDSQPAHAVVLADPEGNGPGHLDPPDEVKCDLIPPEGTSSRRRSFYVLYVNSRGRQISARGWGLVIGTVVSNGCEHLCARQAHGCGWEANSSECTGSPRYLLRSHARCPSALRCTRPLHETIDG